MQKWLILLALTSLCACQTVSSATPSVSPVPAVSSDSSLEETLTERPFATPSPSVTASAVELSEEQEWKSGPHAGIASNVAAVPCRDCHQENAGAVIGSQISWWDAAAQTYESVTDVNALCKKCHQQPKPAPQSADENAAMHSTYPCTACHDPHTTAASCTNSGCHATVRQTNDMPPATPSVGHGQAGNPFCGGRNCHPAATAAAMQPRSVHGAAHVNVTCQACHAAGDLTAGPGPNGGPWVIWQASTSTENTTQEPYFPHAVELQVDCQRCHFTNNSWGLPLVTGNEFQH